MQMSVSCTVAGLKYQTCYLLYCSGTFLRNKAFKWKHNEQKLAMQRTRKRALKDLTLTI